MTTWNASQMRWLRSEYKEAKTMENKDKKNEKIDDSDITIYEQGSGSLSPQKSKKFLAFYIIGLFSVALVLIILSYLTQVRANMQMDVLGNQLNEQIHAASGAKEKAEQLQNLIDDQKKKLKDNEEKIAEMEKAQQDLQAKHDSQTQALKQKEKAAGALDLLWQIEKDYRLKKYSAAREKIEQFEAYYKDVLTGKSLEEYTKIKNALD